MSDTSEVIVIGGGGHAKVVIATLVACGRRVRWIYDDDPKKEGKCVGGVLIRHARDLLETDGFAAVIAVGDNKTRQKLTHRFAEIEWLTAVHPAAVVHESVTVGEGTVIFAGAVVQPETSLGRHVIVNTGASIDHDCSIGDWAHIAPGATLGGNVHVGEGVFVGLGSRLLPGIRVGQWATIGAGAVVTRDVPAGVTVVGVPARPLRKD